MVSALISRVVILVFGTLYPAYASYKAVKTKNVKEYVKWMMYWIVFAFFTCVETFADIFIAWLPFYYELKILFVLWLLSPATKGASYLYRKFIHPQLAKREKEIDAYILQASDKGYSAVISLGSKGLSYATNVVLNTAIKIPLDLGQSKIADHLKKSYSMSDISSDQPDGRHFRKDSLNEEEFEEETDNRLIEESYQREMMEKESQEEDMPVRPRRRQRQQLNEPDTERLSEGEEDANIRGSRSKSKAYSHKEPIVIARHDLLSTSRSREGKSALSSSPTGGALSTVTLYRRSTSDAVLPGVSPSRVSVTRSFSLGGSSSSSGDAVQRPGSASSSSGRSDTPSPTAPWRVRSSYK